MAPRVGRSRLPYLLDKRRMSQADLARYLDVTESFVSHVIKGKSKFSYEMAFYAAKILRCRMEELYEWIDE